MRDEYEFKKEDAKKNPYAEMLNEQKKDEAQERNIFDTPHAGWTCWHINGHRIGPISYLDYVPEYVILTCIRYLTQDNSELKTESFNLYFDAEGWDTGIVQLGEYFYSYDTKTNEEPYIGNLTLLSKSLSGKDFVRWFLENSISDFEKDFDEWVGFDTGAMFKEDIPRIEKRLRQLISTAKFVLKTENSDRNTEYPGDVY